MCGAVLPCLDLNLDEGALTSSLATWSRVYMKFFFAHFEVSHTFCTDTEVTLKRSFDSIACFCYVAVDVGYLQFADVDGCRG